MSLYFLEDYFCCLLIDIAFGCCRPALKNIVFIQIHIIWIKTFYNAACRNGNITFEGMKCTIALGRTLLEKYMNITFTDSKISLVIRDIKHRF